MKRATFLAVAAALLAAIVPAGTSAFQAPKVTKMRLAVEITGIHLVDWHYQSSDELKAENPWVVGSGTQTLGFSSPKPLIYKAIAIDGKTPGGTALEPLTLLQLSAKPLKGSLRRKGSWRYNDPPPCGEGQCDGSGGAPIVRPKPSCPAKRREVPAGLEVSNPGGKGQRVLTVGFGLVSLNDVWSQCPPDMDGAKNSLALGQPRAVFLRGGVERISKLRRGAKLTLKGSAELGRGLTGESKTCPEMSGKGLKECAVTDVTVEVTRLR